MYAANKIGVEYRDVLYKDFMHYGKILKCEDFIFEENNIWFTMKIAELNNERVLFIIRNGVVISAEDLRSGEKW
jgi:hypothetical protein